MSIKIINPVNKFELKKNKNFLIDHHGNTYPIINGVPRITYASNYTDNFGMQWKKFDKIQLDKSIPAALGVTQYL